MVKDPNGQTFGSVATTAGNASLDTALSLGLPLDYLVESPPEGSPPATVRPALPLHIGGDGEVCVFGLPERRVGLNDSSVVRV